MPSTAEKIIPYNSIEKKEPKPKNVTKMLSELTLDVNNYSQKLITDIKKIKNDNYKELRNSALTLLNELKENYKNASTPEEDKIIDTLLRNVDTLFFQIIEASSKKKYHLSSVQENLKIFSNFLQNKKIENNWQKLLFEIAKNMVALFIVGGFTIAGGILGATIGLVISSIFFPLSPIAASVGLTQGVIIGATAGSLLLMAISTLLTKPIIDYITDFSQNNVKNKISTSTPPKLNYPGFFSKNQKVLNDYQNFILEGEKVINNKI